MSTQHRRNMTETQARALFNKLKNDPEAAMIVLYDPQEREVDSAG